MKRTLRGRLYPQRRGGEASRRRPRSRRFSTCARTAIHSVRWTQASLPHAGHAPRFWRQSTVSPLLPKKLLRRPWKGARRGRSAAMSMANSEHIRAKSSSFAPCCHGKPSKNALSLSFAPCRRPLYGRLEIATCGFIKATSAADSRRSEIPRQMGAKLDDIAKNGASLWQTARGAHPDRAKRRPARQELPVRPAPPGGPSRPPAPR